MNTLWLRRLIRKNDDLGHAVAGLFLISYYLFVRRRVPTLAALFVGLAVTCWALKHEPLCSVNSVAVPTASYTVQEITAPSNVFYVYPVAVNSSGMVAGFILTEGFDFHPFLWQNGKMRDLGTLGGADALATGLNDRGQVVGISYTADNYLHAFLWKNGKMQDLSPGAEEYNAAYGINNRGQVAGWALTDRDELHATLWNDGKLKDLGALPGDGFSFAAGVNNNGEAVGTSLGRTARPFISRNDSLQPVPAPGKAGFAVAINDSGQVTGDAWISDDFYHAFVSQGGKSADLGTLGGGDSMAAGINGAGMVVGWSLTASGDNRAFFWQRGRMADLNRLLPANSDWTLQSAQGISERGDVVGIGYHKGHFLPYLLTPAQ
jgi:probable HAF family extracellular repeat protein